MFNLSECLPTPYAWSFARSKSWFVVSKVLDDPLIALQSSHLYHSNILAVLTLRCLDFKRENYVQIGHKNDIILS